jgi:hypothetical protein
MPPCYTFNKICLPDDGMALCQGAAGGTSCADTVTWFWLLAAAVVVGLVMGNSGGGR